MFVGLLRGINVGGKKMVPMAGLRAAVEELGFRDVRTLMQSGNFVFRSEKKSAAPIEKLLQSKLMFDADVVVRSAEEWQALVDRNPFPEDAKRDPSHLLVMCFKEPLVDIDAVRRSIVGRERVHLYGREIYLCYPDGIGTSKLTNAVIERAVGARGTARNWNTVVKLLAAVQT
jgi:uncharacterized protein (DUF1697 family)